MSASTGSGSALSGLAWFKVRCGRWTLKWSSYSVRTCRSPQRIETFKFLIHDRDPIFTRAFNEVFEAEDLKIIRTATHAPRMNAYCERVIGTLRRELLDKVLIVNERHLTTVLTEYLIH
jgi:hypothetical protein